MQDLFKYANDSDFTEARAFIQQQVTAAHTLIGPPTSGSRYTCNPLSIPRSLSTPMQPHPPPPPPQRRASSTTPVASTETGESSGLSRSRARRVSQRSDTATTAQPPVSHTTSHIGTASNTASTAHADTASTLSNTPEPSTRRSPRVRRGER